MRKIAFGVAALAAFWVASPAAATIILDVGPALLTPEEEVLFANGPTAETTIEGVSSQTGADVTLEAGEPVTAFAGGVRVRSSDLAFSSLINFRGLQNQLVGFDLADTSQAFTSTQFRVFGGTATQLTLTFVDTAGEVFQQTFAIPRSGVFNAYAIDGQRIDYFAIAANGTLGDVRQVRIGGVTALVPEPATWGMMLLGFGAAGATLRVRRRLVAV